jgi:hypothetical protein
MVTYRIFKANMMLKSILMVVLISIQSCLKDDVLVMKRVDNNTEKIKLDGYFLESNKVNSTTYFFYQNGVVIEYSSYKPEDSLKIENTMRDAEILAKIKGNKDRWGVYRIEGNNIFMEKWYPSDRPLDAFLKTGTILNDSTFVFDTSSEPDGSKKETINETYRFKKFSPKPDSTNLFIK